MYKQQQEQTAWMIPPVNQIYIKENTIYQSATPYTPNNTYGRTPVEVIFQ